MKTYFTGRLELFLIFIFLSSCIEHFEFESKNEHPALIVDGYISDVSSNEHRSMFFESRFFYAKLKYSGSVANSLDEQISNAEVELINDLNEHWDYTEDANDPGVYYLYYPSFEMVPGVQYKIKIKLENGEEYESNYDLMPHSDVRGSIEQAETTEFQYEVVSEKTSILPIPGLILSTQLPIFADSDSRYFRWTYDVAWKLVAEFSYPSVPTGVCWIGDAYLLDEYVLAEQRGESPKVDLFFLQTSGSRELKFGFSARIRQQEISARHHQFWTDIQNQAKQAELFAPPPYNIYSNINPINNDHEVYGFFGVVNEEFYTWYFDKKSLSYTPSFVEECYVPPNHEPAPWCANCMGYATGAQGGRLTKGETITTEKPKWWTF